MLVTGQLILWAVFQLLSVPMILKQEAIKNAFGKEAFVILVSLFQVLSMVLALCGLFCVGRKYLPLGKRTVVFSVRKEQKDREDKLYDMLWILFWVLLIGQIIMAIFYSYRDEDDAYYVAVASITVESNTMFWKNAYTGGTTGFDARHGLAPFSIWMAFLSKISGVAAVTVAQIFVPVLSIVMAYSIYYLIGDRLLHQENREKLPLFMVFAEILILFGNYSRFTSENFLIGRSRQGKAAIGSLILPLVCYLFLEILTRVQEKRKIGGIWWVLLVSAILSACLCTTMGAVLVCVFIGITALCAAVCYRNVRLLLLSGGCCLPAVAYAILYLVLK